METNGLLAKGLMRALSLKMSKRLNSLTEEEVARWREGTWRIDEEIIERYSERMLEEKELLLGIIKEISPVTISEELVRLKPEFRRYWRDDVFFRRLSEDMSMLARFLQTG